MNLNILIPVISKIVGKDISEEVELFYRTRSAIGNSLSEESKIFFIQNWKSIADFMETEDGQKATADFVDSWTISKMVKEAKELLSDQ